MNTNSSSHPAICETPQAVVTIETTTTTTMLPTTATSLSNSHKHQSRPMTPDSKSNHHHHKALANTSSSSLPRELMNLLPPPVSKAELLKEEKHSPKAPQLPPPPPPPPLLPELPKYSKRSHIDERRLLLAYTNEGLDREDVAFLKRTYDEMTRDDENLAIDENVKRRLKRIKWGSVDEMMFELSGLLSRASTKTSMSSARTRDYSDKSERVKAKQLALANTIVNKGKLIVFILVRVRVFKI